MGANDQEADASSSKKDFIAKCQIVKKETKETHYWLCFTRDAGLIAKSIIDPYITEVVEILKIISKIIDNTKYSEKKSQ